METDGRWLRLSNVSAQEAASTAGASASDPSCGAASHGTAPLNAASGAASEAAADSSRSRGDFLAARWPHDVAASHDQYASSRLPSAFQKPKPTLLSRPEGGSHGVPRVHRQRTQNG